MKAMLNTFGALSLAWTPKGRSNTAHGALLDGDSRNDLAKWDFSDTI